MAWGEVPVGAVHTAIARGDVCQLRAALARGGDPNGKAAREYGCHTYTSLIGESEYARVEEGCSPLGHAIAAWRGGACDDATCVELVRALLDGGADPNWRCWVGYDLLCPPLAAAARMAAAGSHATLELLLARGANPAATYPKEGETTGFSVSAPASSGTYT